MTKMTAWSILSPQVIFVLICLGSPLFFLDDLNDKIAFVHHYYNIAAIIIAFVLTLIVVKTAEEKQLLKITPTDATQAEWWLLNAIVIHFLLDGCTFITHFLPKFIAAISPSTQIVIPKYHLHSIYAQIDARFDGSNPIVNMLTFLELIIMFPLCSAMYYAIRTHAPWRAPLQIITAGLQLFGTVIFLGQELFETPVLKSFQFVHIISDNKFRFIHLFDLLMTSLFLSSPTTTVTISPTALLLKQHNQTPCQIVISSFAFMANIVWILIPLWFIYDAFVELTGLVELNVGNVINIGPKTFVFSPLAFDKSTLAYPTSPERSTSDEMIYDDGLVDGDGLDDFHFDQDHSNHHHHHRNHHHKNNNNNHIHHNQFDSTIMDQNYHPTPANFHQSNQPRYQHNQHNDVFDRPVFDLRAVDENFGDSDEDDDRGDYNYYQQHQQQRQQYNPRSGNKSTPQTKFHATATHHNTPQLPSNNRKDVLYRKRDVVERDDDDDEDDSERVPFNQTRSSRPSSTTTTTTTTSSGATRRSSNARSNRTRH